MKKLSTVFCFCAALVILLPGCAGTKEQSTYRKAIQTEFGKQAGFSPDEQRWIIANCPLGMPDKRTGVDFGFTSVIVHEGYVLEHSASDKIPLWVCEEVTSNNVSGNLTRPKPEPFAPEPKLEKGRRAELSDYRGKGYDRGHQVPSADQTQNRRLQTETYYLSNMCPQTGELNQRIWRALEDTVRGQARTNGPLYVITGPMFYDEAEDDPKTADGYVEHKTIGKGVAVPTHFYKVVLWKDAQSKWQGTAVVMKNQKSMFLKPYHFNDYVRSITWIEERTGLNFNPKLPGPDVGRVERAANPIWN
jgi:endonuclease G